MPVAENLLSPDDRLSQWAVLLAERSQLQHGRYRTSEQNLTHGLGDRCATTLITNRIGQRPDLFIPGEAPHVTIAKQAEQWLTGRTGVGKSSDVQVRKARKSD